MDGPANSIRFDSLPNLSDPLVIAAFRGWNDGGQASTNTVKQLIRQLDAKRFAVIDPEAYFVFTEERPTVSLVEGETRRKIDWQENDFFHGTLPGTGRDVVLFLGNEPNLKWRTFCAEFSWLLRQLDARFVVTLGAYLADVLYSLPVQINGFASDLSLVDDEGITRTTYEGPTGIVGVLNSLLQEDGLDTMSLWAAVPYYISIPNPKAVFAILSTLRRMFSFDLDLKELEEKADNFDNEINDVVANDPNVAAYVRELKKREFLN